MPSKKKRYNARFPPARIKKIMQTDEDVGKVAAAVPVIISRALELFIESLIVKSSDTTKLRRAKTLSTAHIKHTIQSEKRFDFLQDLVESIPDFQVEEESEELPAPSELPKSRPRGRPRKKKPNEEEVTIKEETIKEEEEEDKDSEETDSAAENDPENAHGDFEANHDECEESTTSSQDSASALLEPHKHNDVTKEPHKHNDVKREPHKHNNVKREPHKHNDVKKEPHKPGAEMRAGPWDDGNMHPGPFPWAYPMTADSNVGNSQPYPGPSLGHLPHPGIYSGKHPQPFPYPGHMDPHTGYHPHLLPPHMPHHRPMPGYHWPPGRMMPGFPPHMSAAMPLTHPMAPPIQSGINPPTLIPPLPANCRPPSGPASTASKDDYDS